MNFRIIYHLLKTDWLRLKWLVAAFWAVMVLTALPWLLHDPAGFEYPVWYQNNGNWQVMEYHAKVTQGSFLRDRMMELWLAGSGLSILLAAMIGMHGGGLLAVSPVHLRERVVVRCAALVLLLVLPQSVCLAVNLALHGFPVGIVVRAVLTHATASLLQFGTVAVFAAWCGSPWRWLAGMAAWGGSAAFFAMVIPELFDHLAWAGSHALWLPECGPWAMAFFATAIGLLAAGWPWCRGRLGPAARIAVAVAALTVAGFVASPWPWHFRASQSVAAPAGFDPAAIQLLIWKARIETENSGLNFKKLQVGDLTVNGTLEASGCPPGCYVSWQPVGRPTLTRGSVTLAIGDPPVERRSRYDTGQFRPLSYRSSRSDAMLAALPGQRWVQPGHQTDDFRESSKELCRLTPTGLEGPAAAPVHLGMAFSGTLYRYLRVLDWPVADPPATVRDGSVTYRLRRFGPAKDRVWVEIAVSHPAVGWSASPDEIDWLVAPTEQCRYFLHLPASGRNIQLDQQFRQDGPLLSGAGWHRYVYGAPDSITDDLAGARFIMLKPVVVAHLPTVEAGVPVKWEADTEKYRDFAANREDTVPARYYLEHWLPLRPDPQTCSRGEFGRWLRVAPFVDRIWDVPTRDLAEYAGRFGELLATAANEPSATAALRLGLPESAAGMIVDRFRQSPAPGGLLQVIAKRGWLAAAEPAILERFDLGDLRDDTSGAVLSLENPATYSELIAELMAKPELRRYERIRLLPGIEPMLRGEITAAAANASHQQWLAIATKRWAGPFPNPYLLAAKEGQAEAFDRHLVLYQRGGVEGPMYCQCDELRELIAAPTFTGSINQAWFDFLANKTAAAFRYDSLSRQWVPVNPAAAAQPPKP